MDSKGADIRSHLRSVAACYRAPNLAHSLRQLTLTVFLWGGTYVLGQACIVRSWPVGILLAVLNAAFLVRVFMLQHDCGHRSFFRSRRANDAVGFCLGVLTMTPYRCWSRFHAQHHRSSGNLDRRGFGDIHTLTLDEYAELTPGRRAWYRVYRHPAVLLVIGPPLLFILRQRTTYKIPRGWQVERRSVHATNVVLLAACGLFFLAADPRRAIVFHLLAMSFASIAGVWLFYVQHQFPEAYWERAPEWENWRASLQGATFFDLPGPLRWLTANIGLHHIHHLDSRIPNYRLYDCYQGHPEFAKPKRLSLRDSIDCLRLRLWDAQARRMVAIPANLRQSSAGTAQ